MQRLIIHCGLHKTGTTSTQRFLSESGSILDALGYIYPNRSDQSNHHHVVAHCYFGKKLEYLHDFLCHLNVIGSGKHIILSSEEFGTCFLDKEFTQSFHDFYKRFFEINIVLTLRRQDYLLESVFREVVCDSDYRTINVPDFYNFDFLARVSTLSQIFSEKNVKVIGYEYSDNTRNILSAVFEEQYRDLRYSAKARLNKSIHRRAALAISQICGEPGYENRFIRDTIKRNADIIVDDGVRYVLSPAKRQIFFQRFGRRNDVMLKRMGLPDRRIFFPDEPEGRKWCPAKPVSMQEMQAVLRIFARRCDR